MRALCEFHGNRMAVLDAPPAMNPQQIKEWRSGVAMYDSVFAAFYYPWTKVENPMATNGADAEILIPPSGHIAGVWARVDETRGVWKAPANETIAGCLDLEYPVTKAEQSLLNPIGINCTRPLGTRGIRIWGGRALASGTDWRYLNVRRLFNMVETTILDGIHLPCQPAEADRQLTVPSLIRPTFQFRRQDARHKRRKQRPTSSQLFLPGG